MIHQNNIDKSKLIKKIFKLKELAYDFDCMGSPAPCKESITCIINFIERLPDEMYESISTHNINPTVYGTIRYIFSIDNRNFEIEFGKNNLMWIITDKDDNILSEIDKVRKFSDKKEIPESLLKELR